jgi:hypothetical protein
MDLHCFADRQTAEISAVFIFLVWIIDGKIINRY